MNETVRKALDRIRESADLGHPEAMLELGKALSSGCGPEHWRAVEHQKGTMGAGIAEAGRWLCLYEPISGSPATGALFSPEPWRGLERTRWPYAIPCDEGSLPELWLLVEMCGFVPGSLIGDLLDRKPGDEVYEDDTFLLLMDGRVTDGDKVRMRTMPSLWFKPTGLSYAGVNGTTASPPFAPTATWGSSRSGRSSGCALHRQRGATGSSS